MALKEYKFIEGDLVFEITRPQTIMHIISCNGLIYHCRSIENGKTQEMAFLERDLKKITK